MRIRCGLAVLGAIAAVGCSSGGDGGTEPGSISISISPTSGIVVRGGNTTTTVTLTRLGGFTGNVSFSVTGAPPGVTATLGTQTFSGNVITAPVTINVDATVAAGTYPLVVHGTGSGVDPAAATFSLTVTAAPSFTLTISPPGGVSMAPGAVDNSKTINITRTNYTAGITFTAENLPNGLTASFAPNPAATNGSVLSLTASAGLAPNTYNITIRGTGPASLRIPGDSLASVEATTTLAVTVTTNPSSFTLGLSPTSLSIAQGGNTPTTTVTINRVNFTGDVTLSVLNLPTGVTAAFAPNPATGTSSVLTLTVAAGAPLGTFTNLSVQGVGTAGTVTTPLSLTITATAPAGNFTLTTTSATSAGVTQGSNTNVTININRTGGNTSNVALTITGTLPAGLMAVPSPASTTGTSSTLAITASGAVPVGAYPIVIHGNATGLGEQLANLTINVTAPAGGGNVMVSFAACSAADKAVWLAFMDGTSGAWTQLTGAADGYQFNVAQSKGSIAWVTTGGGETSIFVQHLTQAELTAGTLTFCAVAAPQGKTVNGTVSNLPANFEARISFGGSGATVSQNGAFQITDADDGLFDLFGYSRNQLGAGGDRAFVKRGENPPNGGSFSVPVNFQDAARAAAAATATATLSGLSGGEISLFHSMSITSGPACTPALLYGIGTAAASFSISGVAASLRVAGDLHNISIFAAAASSTRLLEERFADIAARAASPFVLPAQLPVPVTSDAGGPYKRPMLVLTGMSAEFNLSHTLSYNDQTVTTKSGLVTASQGWVGGSNVTLVLPNFAGVGSFSNAWAPASGDAIDWTATSLGGSLTGCAGGQRFVSASRTGSI